MLIYILQPPTTQADIVPEMYNTWPVNICKLFALHNILLILSLISKVTCIVGHVDRIWLLV
jgi:hypothetical protein